MYGRKLLEVVCDFHAPSSDCAATFLQVLERTHPRPDDLLAPWAIGYMDLNGIQQYLSEGRLSTFKCSVLRSIVGQARETSVLLSLAPLLSTLVDDPSLPIRRTATECLCLAGRNFPAVLDDLSPRVRRLLESHTSSSSSI